VSKNEWRNGDDWGVGEEEPRGTKRVATPHMPDKAEAETEGQTCKKEERSKMICMFKGVYAYREEKTKARREDRYEKATYSRMPCRRERELRSCTLVSFGVSSTHVVPTIC
jgi:hypothetical protein